MGPRAKDQGDGEPGRVYLAVRVELMRRLRAAALPCELVQVHPTPAIERARSRSKPASKRRPSGRARSRSKSASKQRRHRASARR